MILLTVLCVVVALVRGEPIREPLEAVWLSWGGMPLIFAVGLPVLLLVGLVTTSEERHQGEQDDVLLSINEAGVYLGGEQPRTIPWSDVHGICRVERHEVNSECEEAWHPYLVVLRYDGDALPPSSKAWGPSDQWPGTVEILGRPLPYDDLVTAVARTPPRPGHRPRPSPGLALRAEQLLQVRRRRRRGPPTARPPAAGGLDRRRLLRSPSTAHFPAAGRVPRRSTPAARRHRPHTQRPPHRQIRAAGAPSPWRISRTRGCNSFG